MLAVTRLGGVYEVGFHYLYVNPELMPTQGSFLEMELRLRPPSGHHQLDCASHRRRLGVRPPRAGCGEP